MVIEVDVDSSYITAQKIQCYIKGFFSKCKQICRFLWSHSSLLKKYFFEKLLFCTAFVFLYLQMRFCQEIVDGCCKSL